MADVSFRDFVLEQLDALPALTCRRMFGGHGLYGGDVFFGIIHKALGARGAGERGFLYNSRLSGSPRSLRSA